MNDTGKTIEVGAARPAGKPHRTVPIGMVFAAAIALLVAAPLAVVVLLNVTANTENTFALLNQRALLLVEAIESGARRHLEDAAGAVDFIARQHREGAVDLRDRGQALAHLKGAITALPEVEALIVFRNDAMIAGVFREPSGTYGELAPGPVAVPDITRELARAVNTTGGRWGDLVFREGEVYANYAAALEPGNPAGAVVVVAAVSVTTLSEVLSRISDRFGTTAFILDGDRVLAHPNLVSGHPEVTEEAPTVAFTRIGDPVVAAFPEREELEEFSTAGAEGVEVSAVEVGDQPYIMILRTVEGFGPRPWVIGAYFVGDDVGDEVSRLVTVAAVSLGGLVIALALALLIARVLSRPVRRFTEQATMITNLELEKVAHLPRSRIRELDHGAVAFNAMLDGLKAFAAYVPRTLVTRLVHSGIKATTQSVERELTIMFTDIVGFTTLSERLSAGEAAHLINHHFRILARIVEAHGGTVDKFMGDAMMAFWGAPEPLERHAEAACRTALAIEQALKDDNERRTAEGGPVVRVRIGIHTGRVIVGNVGGGGRINYTVIGDTVNVTQRLEDLGHVVAPTAEAALLVSAETARQAGSAFAFEEVGTRALRGRAGETRALRLLGLRPPGAGPEEAGGPA